MPDSVPLCVQLLSLTIQSAICNFVWQCAVGDGVGGGLLNVGRASSWLVEGTNVCDEGGAKLCGMSHAWGVWCVGRDLLLGQCCWLFGCYGEGAGWHVEGCFCQSL